MARKYTRDNRGRFASGGGGATARGGRLKTAAGNKRATQTMKAAGGGGDGVMKGAVKRDPGAMAKVGKAKPKQGLTGLGKAPKSNIIKPADLAKVNPNAFAQQYKWNKGGTALATPTEQRKMWGRERLREKKQQLAPVANRGIQRATRRAEQLVAKGAPAGSWQSTRGRANEAVSRRADRAASKLGKVVPMAHATGRDASAKVRALQEKQTPARKEKAKAAVKAYKKADRSKQVLSKAADIYRRRLGR